jgi:putative endonuclease
MNLDPRRPTLLGRCTEEIAAQWLRMNGIAVLDRNRRAAGGEVDLVARDGAALVFVEVRCRRTGSWVGGAGSIDRRKWSRLRACARRLAGEPGLRWPGRTLRIDAVIVEYGPEGLSLRHLRNLREPARGR